MYLWKSVYTVYFFSDREVFFFAYYYLSVNVYVLENWLESSSPSFSLPLSLCLGLPVLTALTNGSV